MHSSNSMLLPEYQTVLSDPTVESVLLIGTGGGFDFVHSLTLIPELKRMGKSIVIGSYSFGDPALIGGAREVPGFDGVVKPLVKLVCAENTPDPHYGPEVGVCQFLDEKYPADAPHNIYAYYARDFVPETLAALYVYLCVTHEVDAIVAFDGGSDSLMRGNEAGLGDPVEDATTIAAVHLARERLQKSARPLSAAMLIAIGIGCDRFNGVSDAATLRAISELNREGAFLGCAALTRHSPLTTIYSEAIDFLQARARFRSVIANSIVEAARGAHGADVVPTSLQSRVQTGELFLWTLMSFQFAFCIEALFKRSITCHAILEARTVNEMHNALQRVRSEMRKEGVLLPEEHLPA